jgi:adenine-specific DNA-methyltransferase
MNSPNTCHTANLHRQWGCVLIDVNSDLLPSCGSCRRHKNRLDTPINYNVIVMSEVQEGRVNFSSEQKFPCPDLEPFNLGNRRYLGSKSKLLSNIEGVILGRFGRVPESFFDAFAGSGVVGARFAELGSRVVMNDLLLHNCLAHQTFLLHDDYAGDTVKEHLRMMAKLSPNGGYIAENFGGNYFSKENASKLDSWREYIAESDLDSATSAALITCVIYAADKIAQTVGHYDAFFASNRISRQAELRFPMPIGSGSGHMILNSDANEIVAAHEVEVLYLDPPYNSRQYSDNYHLPENIARWEKPKVHGVSKKMDRSGLKSSYSGRKAEQAFDELITRARAEMIVLSYSNTGTSRVSRSNNILSDEFISAVLGQKGRLTVEEIEFKEFSVGRTSNRPHKERLFICEVGRR